MTGDPLDRIETREALHGWFPLTRDERDALVEVARAARPFAKPFALPSREDVAALREALARLDGPR